jgi:DNA-binding transcriptional regulator YdaS (Cro superfamily)
MAITHLPPQGDESPIERAIRLAGGPTTLARELKARGHDKVNSHATVKQWVVNGRVPAQYCPDIEDITGIPCEELNTDVPWGKVRDRRTQPRPETGASAQQAG